MTTRLTIDRLGHHGDGIAPGPVYVPMSLPGEMVEGTPVDGRLDAPRILEPSEHRVSPPCGHYKSCGGCAVMHASDAFVSTWKAEVIAAALAAQNLPAPLRPTQTSPPQSRRRATLAARRTKKGTLVGFHARRSDTIVPIEECQVLQPEILDAIPSISEMTKIGGSRSATLSFALTVTDTGLDCAVTGGKSLDGPLQAALPQLRGPIARLSWSGEPVYAETTPQVTIGTTAVRLPPGAFLQATRAGETALQAAVREAVGPAARVADLFAGCGTFALDLAARVPVHAVEGADDLVAALQMAVRGSTRLKPLTVEARDLFRRPLLAEDLEPYEAIVIDPPRAGAEAQTTEIAKAAVPRVAMVSCNPVTFARDAACLIRAGYRLNWVQPIDQFRWSAHVELAASLSLPHLTDD